MATNSKGRQPKKSDVMPGFFERGPGAEGIVVTSLPKANNGGKTPAKKSGASGTKKK